MPRIMTVVGARPQFIKAAPVSSALVKAGLTEILVHTGQHFNAMMSDVFFDELGIRKPAYNLEISSLGHGAMSGRMLEKLEETMMAEKPDLVLVYGDTNSTLAGALAAVKLHIPVAHVESGLRSFNRRMPEEINRVLTDQCSDVLFTPTDLATENLRREGIPEERIVQVGDVMFDVALYFSKRAEQKHPRRLPVGVEKGAYILATVHRQENTDDHARLAAILEGLQTVAREIRVVLPLHPRTRGRIEAANLADLTRGLTVVEPLGYLDIVSLERDAAVIATDSGGMQKEAFFHRVPCVTLRDETEWMELVDSGWNRLTPPASAAVVIENIKSAIGTTGAEMSPYGDGDSAPRMVEYLRDFLS